MCLMTLTVLRISFLYSSIPGREVTITRMNTVVEEEIGIGAIGVRVRIILEIRTLDKETQITNMQTVVVEELDTISPMLMKDIREMTTGIFCTVMRI